VESRNEGVVDRTPVPEPTQVTPPTTVPPPVVSDSTTPAPTADAVATAPVAPPPPVTEAAPIQQDVPTPSVSVGNYDVQRNDSLWKIASQLRPGTPSEINQTMIALYRANPQAFVGNINRLRAGAVLRVPSTDEVTSIDTREANSEVTRQLSEWRPQPAPVPAEPTPSAEVVEPGRLRLVTPTEPAATAEATRASQAEKAAAAAAADAKAAQESARTTAERTAADAKARTDAEAKRLLDLKNAELARMQLEREQQAAEAAAAKAAADAQAAAAAAAAQTPTPAPSAEPAPVEMPAEEVPTVEAAPKPAEPALPPVPAAEESSFFSDLPWSYILGGLGIVALLGGWVWNSRRRPTNASVMPSFPLPDASARTMTPSDFNDAFGEETPARAHSSSRDFDAPESIPEAEGTKPLYRSGQALPDELPRAPKKSIEDTLSSETAIHTDQPDALAEADFHMAYGLYDQAADLVKIAIERQPQRADLKRKLLDVAFVWGNKELYVDTARDLQKTRDQLPAGEWDKILIMGKQIAPENPLFSGGTSSAGDMLDVNLEGGENRVDFDLFSTPEAGANEPAATLDFELNNTGERAKPEEKLDFLLEDSGSAPLLADDDTREMDGNARTQETPTIEMPAMGDRHGDTGAQTIREKTILLTPPSPASSDRSEQSIDRTAELSLDDLGLHVGSLESTGSLEKTMALGRGQSLMDDIGDEELTRIAPASEFMARAAQMESTREMPQIKQTNGNGRSREDDDNGEDVGVSTIYLEQLESSSGELVDTMGLGGKSDETAHMLSPAELDLDLAKLSEQLDSDDTIRRRAKQQAAASGRDAAATVEHPRPKTDRSDVLIGSADMPEMEPVTMSEVGTKLDLARAYMDMGDPDGARSILEEVQQEGNSGQRAEAQRLLESIR
ncbi:MAG: hypothetical protein H7Y02_13515, partial [Candidatus Obscuribacterales bacterium]|nr:hypothetical protein [Steroidobacteraceae bacterium]